MKSLRLCAAALLCALAAAPAWALDTSTGSGVDLAPVLNPLIQGVGILVAGCIGTIAVFAVNWARGKMHLQAIQIDAGLQAKIDAGAQKFIGGLVARAQVPLGKITVDTHNATINEAANKFAAAYGDTLKQIGSADNVAKAREIIVNRLGMMTAAAQGVPIPNPSQDAPAATTLAPAKA